ncbi:hypothetical protein GCM10010919_28260 [Alishewanella longhuensis]|uniref:Cell division protein ZapA n=1 Tax=Alishewanella longhuensis TaxID=1091037 RepID=A0ABQ3L1L6_9ALTE|nr:cell division protein ZapA [Alishewanella longhuensis]GHG74648.1 hypothetical protein GCM10010919_28260 [Alishewanella longhuensis]
MSDIESCTVQILGRQYRFKHPSDKQQQLTSTAAELDLRLKTQVADLPLATRDQLLILTAINLLNELSELQQQTATCVEQLVAQIKEAG